MHNGCIADFRSIIRKLQADLSDEYFNFPQGNTDSEWAFACFLQRLSKVNKSPIPFRLASDSSLSFFYS